MTNILTVHDYLIDGVPEFQARVIDRTDTNVTLRVFPCHSWSDSGDGTYSVPHWEEDSVATIYLKWDGCAHVALADGDGSGSLGWTHVCGPDQLHRYFLVLQWAWNLARSLISKWDEHSGGGPLDVVKAP